MLWMKSSFQIVYIESALKSNINFKFINNKKLKNNNNP